MVKQGQCDITGHCFQGYVLEINVPDSEAFSGVHPIYTIIHDSPNECQSFGIIQSPSKKNPFTGLDPLPGHVVHRTVTNVHQPLLDLTNW